MEKREFNKLFAKLEIGPKTHAAAQLLGVCRRSVYLYSNGEREVPPPVAKLLRLIVLCKAKGIKIAA